jgi:phosphoesterase RecJ-like protein
MSVSWEALFQQLRSHQRFVLTSHIRPDCDALGSELGMAGILEAMGKQVQIINGHPTPALRSSIRPNGSRWLGRTSIRTMFAATA